MGRIAVTNLQCAPLLGTSGYRCFPVLQILPCKDVLQWPGASKMIALKLAATRCAQRCSEAGRLDALNDDTHIKTARHLDQARDQVARLGIGLETLRQGAIDLDAAEPERLEVGNACEACSEIIQRKTYTKSPQRIDGQRSAFWIVDQVALGDFQLQAFRREAGQASIC